MTDPLSHWPRFAELVESRQRAGRIEYGDRSFSRDPLELVGEIEEEIADVAGWAFVLFVRLQRVREALQNWPYPIAQIDPDAPPAIASGSMPYEGTATIDFGEWPACPIRLCDECRNENASRCTLFLEPEHYSDRYGDGDWCRRFTYKKGGG